MGEDWLDMFLEMVNYQDSGVELYLGDLHSTPAEISDVCSVRESNYMRDYITDERGHLSEIRFYQVND